MAVNFFKDSFRREGFIDKSLVKWTKRKNDKESSLPRRKRRGILTQTGELEASIDFRTDGHIVYVFSDKPYAQIHNEGGEVDIPVTPDMRKFFWAMYFQTKEQRWKFMALTKKTVIKVVLEQRQFMGDSDLMWRRLTHHTDRTFDQIFYG